MKCNPEKSRNCGKMCLTWKKRCLLNKNANSKYTGPKKQEEGPKKNTKTTRRPRENEENEDTKESFDYYDTLGLSKKATQKQISNAFSEMKEDYSGRTLDETEKTEWIKIQMAYGILSNPKTRKHYDAIH